jgi:hypothetical protein
MNSIRWFVGHLIIAALSAGSYAAGMSTHPRVSLAIAAFYIFSFRDKLRRMA